MTDTIESDFTGDGYTARCGSCGETSDSTCQKAAAAWLRVHECDD